MIKPDYQNFKVFGIKSNKKLKKSWDYQVKKMENQLLEQEKWCIGGIKLKMTLKKDGNLSNHTQNKELVI